MQKQKRIILVFDLRLRSILALNIVHQYIFPKVDCSRRKRSKNNYSPQLFKQYLNRENIKVSSVPHIEGLTIEDFLQYAQQKAIILKYLPDQRDWVHIDRQWICDIIYTLDQDGFQQKINYALNERKEKMEKNRDLIVYMRPEFALALNNCINFSLLDERGRSINLLKPSSKRKRLRSEIEVVKQEEGELKKDKNAYLKNVKRLKREKEMLELQINQLQQINAEYAQLYGHENEDNNQTEFDIQ